MGKPKQISILPSLEFHSSILMFGGEKKEEPYAKRRVHICSLLVIIMGFVKADN